MIYAPILIPTLNRYEHLKKCIKSLQKNPWAKRTVVYISIDYPTKENQLEGYNQIINFFNSGVGGFKDIIIYKQKINLGAYGNYLFLIQKAFEKYDRFIFSEDDNVFAPNFIEYIDRGLEIFEDDNEIWAICSDAAYGATNTNAKGNIAKSQIFAAYGFGGWKTKFEQFCSCVNRDYYLKIANKFLKIIKMIKYSPSVFLAYVATLQKSEKVYVTDKGDVALIDEAIKIYLLYENMWVIEPCSIISTNEGYDGTGENCEKVENIRGVKLSQESTFIYNIPEKLYECSKKEKITIIRMLRIAVALLKIFILYIGGEKKFYSFANFISKIKNRIAHIEFTK